MASELKNQGLRVDEKLLPVKTNGTVDEVVDALILEIKKTAGPDVFQTISDLTVLQMTKLLQNDLVDFLTSSD